MRKSKSDIGEYMREIKEYQILSAEQEVELSKKMRSGNEKERNEAIEKLICSNLQLVVKIAYAYIENGISIKDLISEGNIGLMKAATKFDHTKGAKFSSYAAWWIRQTISRSVIRTRNTIRKPIPFVHLENKVMATANILESVLGRKPTLKEIEEKTNVSGKKISDIMKCSISMCPLNNSDGGIEQSINDIAMESGASPDTILENEERERLLKESLNSMTETERQIIERRFGINGNEKCRLNKIGKDIHKSTERVRQIEESAIKKMRRYFEQMGYCGG